MKAASASLAATEKRMEDKWDNSKKLVATLLSDGGLAKKMGKTGFVNTTKETEAIAENEEDDYDSEDEESKRWTGPKKKATGSWHEY